MHLLWKVSLLALLNVLSQGHADNKRDVIGPMPLNKQRSEEWKFPHEYGRSKKIDCVVSDTWSAWEGPHAFGGYKRYRSIITQPKNGGRPCPTDLVQTKSGPKPTVQQVTKAVEKNFLRRGSQSNQRYFNPYVQTADLVKRDTNYYKSRDLLVILGSSSRIGSRMFTEVKNDIAELLGLLCPADGSNDPFKNSDVRYHQAAFLKYSSYVKEEFDFDDRHPTSTLQSAIRNISYIGGGTATDLAFKHAISMFDSNNKGLRNNAFVQKEVLILIDGPSNCKSCSIKAARELRNRRFGPNEDEVKVYALTIGDFSSQGKDEVKQYVSHPPGHHLFALDGFDQLRVLLRVLKTNVGHTFPCVDLSIG